MADDYQDIGSEVVFPQEPSWSRLPETSISISRIITQYRATSQQIDQITADSPIAFRAGFQVVTKAEEYELLDFFNGRRGRNKRFFIAHPKTHFFLKSTSLNGSTALTCEPNRSNIQYQGYERIYVIMNTGDILSRRVTQVVYNSGTDDITVTISTPLDRDLTTLNHARIGRFLLARFDDDEMTQQIQSDTVSEIEFPFVELVNEYSEI